MADPVLAAQLKRLDAGTTLVSPGFDYDSLLQRHEESRRRAHRRLTLARGTAAAVMLARVRLGYGPLPKDRPPGPEEREEP